MKPYKKKTIIGLLPLLVGLFCFLPAKAATDQPQDLLLQITKPAKGYTATFICPLLYQITLTEPSFTAATLCPTNITVNVKYNGTDYTTCSWTVPNQGSLRVAPNMSGTIEVKCCKNAIGPCQIGACTNAQPGTHCSG